MDDQGCRSEKLTIEWNQSITVYNTGPPSLAAFHIRAPSLRLAIDLHAPYPLLPALGLRSFNADVRAARVRSHGGFAGDFVEGVAFGFAGGGIPTVAVFYSDRLSG